MARIIAKPSHLEVVKLFRNLSKEVKHKTVLKMMKLVLEIHKTMLKMIEKGLRVKKTMLETRKTILKLLKIVSKLLEKLRSY